MAHLPEISPARFEISTSETAQMKARSLDLHALYARAQSAGENAYAPYSHFRVGAALLTEDGGVITGSNMENASYGLTICAERIAVGHAVSGGHRHFQAIAISVTGESSSANAGAPCGACLQVLSEFSPAGDLIVAFPEGSLLRVVCLADLLPVGFSL